MQEAIMKARGTRAMGLTLIALLGLSVPARTLDAQGSEQRYRAVDAAEAARVLVADSVVITEDTAIIRGEAVPYRVQTGTQPVWDGNGNVIASVFYVAYVRADVEDPSRRPLTFSFNGGPGAASVWMHIGYTGPRRVIVDDEGFPVQPYGVVNNPHSVLDVTDLVFVDPVNTGFSRPVGDASREHFFGVNQDIAYLAEWIDTWVSRNHRWESPKYLIGESYGTTRVAGLSHRLQSHHRMHLNGVVLVSPTALGLNPQGPEPRAAVLKLPYYAATAWYHRQLDPTLQNRDLHDLLPEVEVFTLDELLPALARGGFLDPERRSELARQVARYSGLSEEVVRNNNLAVSESRFWKELLRHEGYTVGRLDSRYKGVDRDDGGETREFDAAIAAWGHSFTPAINHYLRHDLGWETDLRYYIGGQTGGWDRSGDTTGEDLRRALAENPFLHVMIQGGFYDGATDYFSAKYTMWNLDPSGKLRNRLRFEGYRSGHMMYLRKEDLETSNEHIREFIQESTPGAGTPAMWR